MAGRRRCVRSENVNPRGRPLLLPVAATTSSICLIVRPNAWRAPLSTARRCASSGRSNDRVSAARRLTAGSSAPRRLVHIINAANERVYPGAIFMMHLRRLARLRKRVSFVNQENDGTACPAACALQRGGRFNGVVERGRKQLRHLPNTPLTSARQAQWKQRDLDLLLARNRIADRLRQLRLPRSNVACEHNQRWST